MKATAQPMTEILGQPKCQGYSRIIGGNFVVQALFLPMAKISG